MRHNSFSKKLLFFKILLRHNNGPTSTIASRTPKISVELAAKLTLEIVSQKKEEEKFTLDWSAILNFRALF